MKTIRTAVRRILPPRWVANLKQFRQRLQRRLWPVSWKNLRSVRPVSDCFGFDRGQPTNRYYVEKFLSAQRTDIRGRVLEIASPGYTRKFGDDRVTQSDVLHAVAGNPQATLVGDLQTGVGIPTGAFDCIILTETLIFVYDLAGALHTVSRALKPGGVALITTAGIAQVSRPDMDSWGEYWRFTDLSLRRHLERHFPPEAITITAHGNVLAATALLHGISTQELTTEELDFEDPDYQVTVTARIVKPANAPN